MHNRTIFQKSHLCKLPQHSHFSSVPCKTVSSLEGKHIQYIAEIGGGFCVAGCSAYTCTVIVKTIPEWKPALQSANTRTSWCRDPRVSQQKNKKIKSVYHNDNDYPDLCILSLSHGCCHSNTSMSYQVQPLWFFFFHCNLFRLFTVGMTTGYWVVAFISMLIELTAIVC